MRVMRYVIAVMLMWGGIQFSYAQENQNNKEVDCPPALEEGSTEGDLYNEPSVQGNEDAEFEYDSETDQSKLEIESETGESEIEYKDDQTEFEMESDEAPRLDDSMDAAKDCPNIEESTSDAGAAVYTTETNVIVLEEEKKERSTFGKIWRSPFKLVGNIPKAAVSAVSETAEGVGHIVGAPFKAVGKLFGAEEDDNDDFADSDNM